MKSTNALALAALFSLVACAAPGSEESNTATVDLAATNTPKTPAAAAAPAPSHSSNATSANVYRGSFEVMGSPFSLEVELTSKQTVKQTKYCDAGGPDEAAFAGSYASPDYAADVNGGSVRTIVRDAYGTIVGEASFPITAFSADNFDVDVASQCKKGGQLVADTAPMTDFAHANPLVWVPGVVANTASGPIWINPSYGGAARVAVSFEGTAKYEAVSNASSTRPRPFGGAGQELVFEKGELTFVPGPASIELEIGADVDPTGSHARDVRIVSLSR